MFNREGSHHEHFEELCALAASGLISEPDFVELRDHLQQCADCQSTYNEFIDLIHDKLPLAHPDVVGSSKRPDFVSTQASYQERFLARARKEGIAVSGEPVHVTAGRRWREWFLPGLRHTQLATLAVAVLLVVGVLSYGLYQSNARYRKLASNQADLVKQLSLQGAVSTVLEDNKPPVLPPDDAVPIPGPAVAPDRATEVELARVRSGQADAEERAKVLEDQAGKVALELAALRAQSEQTSVSREEVQKKLKDAEQLANILKENLQEIRQARSKDSLTIAAQDVEIQKMSERLNEQAEMLEQDKALLEASRDVRDLMGACSFHIADVYDVDSKGKNQRAFGRVFYNEGKSTLIIFAFDLNDRTAAKRNASFQVWGKRGPAQAPTHSLGLLRIDDQKQNRWVLRFEDQRVLAEIDSVFVTVEPPGGSEKPTGPQFLNAYLDTNPNRQ